MYFPGDTAFFEDLPDSAIEPNLVLIPVWGWGPTLRGGHLDPHSAARILEKLRPDHALPIHWGTFWPPGLGKLFRSRLVDPAQEFARHSARLAPSVRLHILSPGETREIAIL